ncbi:MAG TPA: magnesium/cobalt transporter CorA [Thermoplasmata archaeon]|jgi:magnesium transporter
MVRVEVVAYSPTEFLEETDVSVGRCRDLLERFHVTWVNIVDPDGRTLEELETLFGFHPLALEDAATADLPPKVEVYDEVVFVVARTIVWAEEIETDQLSMFVGPRFVVTLHDRIFPQLEDVRIRLRKKTPRLIKAGSDFLAYSILDMIVDSYFPHLDRFQDILDSLEDEIVEQSTGVGINKVHDIRVDLTLIRNALRPQRDLYGTIARLEIPTFRRETRNYLRDVQDHMIRVLDTLDTYREVAVSLMEVGATLASNQMNQVIKVLTVLFTITIPLTIVTSAFGMNVSFPGFNAPEGLYIAMSMMILPTLVLFVWLWRKGWL